MVRTAVRFLASRIQSHWRVLELGAGRSTVWFAARAGDVLALEDDPRWQSEVSHAIAQQGLGNCRVEYAQLEEFVGRIRAFPDETFDLVVVDSNENGAVSRVDCARASISKVKLGGLLVFDDFDRHAYRSADALLHEWPRRQFTGIKGFPMTAVETAIFVRPSPIGT
jgi:predicted O-methyltransferase YrrM